MSENESPWTIGYPALAEHDPVRLHDVFDRRTCTTVDVVSQAEAILGTTESSRFREIAKKTGIVIFSGLIAVGYAYSMVHYAEGLSSINNF